MAILDGLIREQLDRLEAGGRLREIKPCRPLPGGRVEREGRILVDMSSNDYLGLSFRPELMERARDFAFRFGAGARGSRLVTGTLSAHMEVEAKLAAIKGFEAALIFGSGFVANSSVLPALFDRELVKGEALVFTDRLNHASLHAGCTQAGVRQIRFRHNDLGHLEDLLKKYAGQKGMRYIVTESVFSMDGDTADVVSLAGLAERFGAVLYLDEAHATGVIGPSGAGLAGGRVELAMGTFGKALGGFGAYVACSAAMRDWLVNRAGGFIYATAPPPAVLGAMDAALDLLPGLEEERGRLHANADRLRSALNRAGISYGSSSTQIVPAIIGEAGATLAASHKLEEAGVLGIAIRPPTVPEGSSRIRLAASAAHDDEAMDMVVSAIGEMVP